MNSQLSAHIVGHLIAEPRIFELRNGVGCDLRVLVTRRYYDGLGIPSTAETRLKVVTYDTVMAERLVSEFKAGNFVELIADNVRGEKAWENKDGKWVSGSAVFHLAKIRHVPVEAPTEAPAEQATETPEVLARVVAS